MKIKKVYLGRKQIYPEITDLLAHYELNGDLRDSSGNGYDLTNAWNTTFTTLTSWKKVLSVQDTSAYLTQSFDFSWKDISIMWWVRDTASRTSYEDRTYFWLKTTSSPSYDSWNTKTVMMFNKQWPSQSNSMCFRVDSKQWEYTVNNTNRHHVVGTFNRTDAEIKMYIDTTLRSTKTNATQTRTAWCIFIWCKWVSSTVKIQVWEFILYAKELTTEEIQTHYNATKYLYGIS